MNNRRLLTGLLLAPLLSAPLCSLAQKVLTLDEIFAHAEQGSTQLRVSFAAEDEAKHEIDVARVSRLPDINSSLSFSYIGDGFTTKRDFGDYQRAEMPHFGNGFELNVNQPLYTGGAITSGIKMAELKSTAARYATDFNRDRLRFQLTGFYLDIYKYSKLSRVVDANIAAARKVLNDMQVRYANGMALRNDITRYELLVTELELELTRIKNTLTILNNNLVVTAGLPKGTVVVPDSTILAQSLPQDGEAWWQQEALSNSPRLNLARTGIDINRKAEDLVRAQRLPKIGINAAWNINGPILIEVPPINRNFSYWYVGLGISFDISSLYKTKRSLAKTQAATQCAVYQLDDASEALSMDVRADHVRWLEAYEELKSCQKSVELAEINYNTTETRYGADMALITDMLDAANSRLAAEQSLVNVHINIIYYYYKLLFITGKI